MDQEALPEYLAGVLGERVVIVAVRPLGGQDAEGKDPKGLGYGVPFEVECRVGSDVRRLVVARTRVAQGFGHEYPADRAWQAIYGHAAYNGFPAHVRSVDVGFARRSGALVSAGDAAEFFQLVAVPGVPVRVPRRLGGPRAARGPAAVPRVPRARRGAPALVSDARGAAPGSPAALRPGRHGVRRALRRVDARAPRRPRRRGVSWAIWITGPPGSGKSTIARAVEAELRARGRPVERLELDEVRKTVTPEPRYSDDEQIGRAHV